MKNKYQPGGISVWIAAAVFLGAFLLFQVQPVISKTILPWFGGSPAVWTTCLLFFQLLLLAGYALANWLTRWPQPRQQALIHGILVGLAVLTLPITPGDSWKPEDGAYPAARIMLLLTVKIGLPYFILAATSPAMQFWFARVYPDRSPYRLYALSNIGSLGALLSYPLLVEPTMTTRTQGNLWSVLFLVFAVCCAWLTYRLWHAGPLPEFRGDKNSPAETSGADHLTWRRRLTWLLWPALACILLMAVTNHLCQDLAVVPLLWVAPLSLYLLTFIICFDREAWYRRRGFALAAALSVMAVSYLPLAGYFERFYRQMGVPIRMAHITKHVAVETLVYLIALFLLCMVCHGELVRRKPPARYLTSFYLSVAGGGALGGVFVAVICPLLFSSFVELNAALLISFLVTLAVLVSEVRRQKSTLSSPVLRFSAIVVGWLATGVVGWGQFDSWDSERGIARARNFYGVLAVRERFSDEPDQRGLALFHGNTIHGYQLLQEELKDTPTTYYGANSGVGLTLQNYRPDGPIRVGAVGLGTGTIAVYGRPGDLHRFYEINPLVVDMARRYFTFLEDSKAKIEIVPGDARLSLDREPPQQYDVLVLDAFSGDTIPVHLLTQQAMDIYERQIAPDGVIAIHVSNRYVNLIPVVVTIADHSQLPCVLIRQQQADKYKSSPSDWILLTRNQAFLQRPAIRDVSAHPDRRVGFPLWTDQYNNLLQILHPPVITVDPNGDSG